MSTDNNNTNLLDLAQIAAKQPIKRVNKTNSSQLNSVDRFIKRLNIKAGDTLISSPVVFYHYWKTTNNHTKLSVRTFFRLFAKVFTKKVRKYNYVYYYLDKTPFDLTVEKKAREILRLHYKNNYGKKEKNSTISKK